MKPGLCNFAVAFAIVGFTSVALGYQVYGAIGEKWNSLWGAGGFLGSPLTDELDTSV